MKIPQKPLTKGLLLFFLALGCSLITRAQSNPSKEEKEQAQQVWIKNLVDSQLYIFDAHMAIPLGGRTIQLTGNSYDLKITRDAIVSDLPYYGRAYSAPLDPAKSGVQFTSKKFDYRATSRKKGGWDILIRTKDMQEDWQLSLTITQDGYANLQVNGGSRSPISFSGLITELQQQR